MIRRSFLSSAVAISLSGCVGAGGDDLSGRDGSEYLDLDDGERYVFDGVSVYPDPFYGMEITDTIEYWDEDAEDFAQHVLDDEVLVRSHFVYEERRGEERDWPRYEDHLIKWGGGENEPVKELDNGVSVEEIENLKMGVLFDEEYSGIGSESSSYFDVVFVVPESSEYAVGVELPNDERVFWQ